MLALLNQPRCLPVPGFVVGDGTFLCGRSAGCHLILPHPTISRRHAELRVDGSQLELRDLRSRNGMFVDETRVEMAELALGQTFRLGQVSFVIAQADDQELDCGSSLDTASTHALAIARENGTAAGVNELSAAQRRVLDLALAGLVEKQIARRLNIQSPHRAQSSPQHLPQPGRAFAGRIARTVALAIVAVASVRARGPWARAALGFH